MKKVLIAGICILFLSLIYMLIEPYWIEETKYWVSVPGITVPVRIVFLTDIHHGPYFAIDRVRALVDRVNAMQPDIVLFGGDYVHRDPKYIEPVFRELGRIRAKLLKAGVMGNHDHWESKSMTESNMQAAGILKLDNESTVLQIGGKTIRIAGVGDLWEDTQDTTAVKAGVADFTILLTHNPDYIEDIDPATLNKIDLILAGHTHGGQVTLFGIWAPIVPSKYGERYRTGLKTKGKTKILISNGIGTITPPVRFFARPQIVHVVLQ